MSSYSRKGSELLLKMCWKMRILCLYKYINTKSKIIWKGNTYRSSNRSRYRSKNRSCGRGSSTMPCRQQPWKSGILLLEIKRKVVILSLKIIFTQKVVNV